MCTFYGSTVSFKVGMCCVVCLFVCLNHKKKYSFPGFYWKSFLGKIFISKALFLHFRFTGHMTLKML